MHRRSSSWVPIGIVDEGTNTDPGPGFSGTFAEVSATPISNVTTNVGADHYGGVFALNSGVIRDVNATNVNITGGPETGGLVGRNLVGGVIFDSSASGTVTGTRQVGGFVGWNDGVITDSAAWQVSIDGTLGDMGNCVGFNTDTGSITASRERATTPPEPSRHLERSTLRQALSAASSAATSAH